MGLTRATAANDGRARSLQHARSRTTSISRGRRIGHVSRLDQRLRLGGDGGRCGVLNGQFVGELVACDQLVHACSLG